MDNDLPQSSEPPSTSPNLTLPAVSSPFALSPSKHFTQGQSQPKTTRGHFFTPPHDAQDFHHIPPVPDLDQNPPLPPSFTLPAQEDGLQDSSYMDSLNSSLQRFWANESMKVQQLSPYTDEMFHYEMPLARIKKIMRFDETVVMIGADAPILLSKACELLLSEIAIRAWYHTNKARRRTIKLSDLVAALPKSNIFDFLIDKIPREETNISNNYHHQINTSTNNNNNLSDHQIIEEVDEISDREKSQRSLIELVSRISNEINNLQPIQQQQEKELRLPDLFQETESIATWDELGSISRKELQNFPQQHLPLMLALLRSAFENNSEKDQTNKRMKF